MAHGELDLFYLTPSGGEIHLKLVPDAGEGLIELAISADRQLAAAGFGPRPSKFGGGKKPVEPPTTCQQCGGQIISRDWTSQDGKQFKVYKCKQDEKHFKPVYQKVG